MKTSTIKKIVRVLCAITGLLMLLPLALCNLTIIYPSWLPSQPYEPTEPELVDECITPDDEVIRLYEHFNNFAHDVYTITYQQPNSQEKQFYYADILPIAYGVECEGNTVIVIVYEPYQSEHLSLEEIRAELIYEPLCYDRGYECLDFGLIGDSIGEGIAIVMAVVVTLLSMGGFFLIRVAFTGQ